MLVIPLVLISLSGILNAIPLSEIQNEALAKATNEISEQYESFKVSLINMDPKTKKHWTCTHNPQYSVSHQSLFQSRLTVLAQCQTPSWSMLIPLRNEIYAEIGYLNSPKNYGGILNESDIYWKKVNILKIHRRYITKDKIGQFIGMKSRKRLSAGDVIETNQWRFTDIIKKNQHLYLVYEADGVKVVTKGKALEKGHIGKRIMVENLRSKRKLQGIITGSDTVTIS